MENVRASKGTIAGESNDDIDKEICDGLLVSPAVGTQEAESRSGSREIVVGLSGSLLNAEWLRLYEVTIG